MAEGRTKKQAEYWEAMREWVEKNGIYPQRCGAPITKFCKHFGIDIETYRNWVEAKDNSEFSEMIKTANGVFLERTGEVLENALIKLAVGFEDWEETQEGTPDDKGGVKIKKLMRKKKIVPPNLGAISYLQCNLYPDRWTNPMKIEAKVNGSLDIVAMTPEEARKKLEEMESIEIKRVE